MFAIIKNSQVVQYVQPNTLFYVNWVEYGADWIVKATQAQKDAIGLVEVVHGNRADERFYWVTQQEPVYDASTNQVIINFTATPKDLAAIQANLVNQINNTAYTLLLPSDWMVVKAMETGGVVSSNWTTWRQTIRTQAANYCDDINACTSMEKLEQLPFIQWARSPNEPELEITEPSSEV